jgi:hypothetical protein
MEPLVHLFVQSLARDAENTTRPRSTRPPAWRRLLAHALREPRRSPLPTRRPAAS